MQKLTKVRTSLNQEKRDLIVRGTSYSNASAVFATIKLFNFFLEPHKFSLDMK